MVKTNDDGKKKRKTKLEQFQFPCKLMFVYFFNEKFGKNIPA